MKVTTVAMLFLAISIAAFGQYGVQAPSSSPYTIPDHPQHTSQGSMLPEANLLGTSDPMSGHGELPLWEFGSPLPPPPSLGDVARAYRKEHKTIKKAKVVWRP